LKIVLFGSHAKGTADGDSDVDLLVIGNTDLDARETIADITLDIQMELGVGLEPIVATVDELFPVTSYFLHNVMRYGTEVYSVSTEEMKNEERRNLLSLSEEYLAAAQGARDGGSYRAAVDLGYNAAELAAKSLILERDDDLPGSHGGLVGRFWTLFIKTGRFDRALGRELNRGLEKRNGARYEYRASIGSEEAEAVLALARRLKDLAEGELV
jgi:uncharacterized protein (UPF0332 family)